MGRRILAELFLCFMKIGVFTFGGGYAMISMIEDQCVEKKGWITHEDMMNVTVIAESTPGPIAINCATFVGYRQSGWAGALASTLGIVLPSFAIIYVISILFDHFLEIRVIAHAFAGIRIAVGILITDAALTMIKKMKKKAFPCMIMAGAFATMFFSQLFAWGVSSVSLMVAAALLGIMTAMEEKTKKLSDEALKDSLHMRKGDESK